MTPPEAWKVTGVYLLMPPTSGQLRSLLPRPRVERFHALPLLTERLVSRFSLRTFLPLLCPFGFPIQILKCRIIEMCSLRSSSEP